MTAPPADAARARRERILEAHGAAGAARDELLAYTARPVEPPQRPRFPLDDEPHLAAWSRYAADAASHGAVRALAERFVQLRFPVREGISGEAAYREATRKGRFDAADPFAPGLVLARPEGVRLQIHDTIAGRVPVVTAADRRDFVALVQAFTDRNEPVPVPGSMGACIVTGLNNWDRLHAYRRDWSRRHPDATEAEWLDEFRRVAQRKELYQDRFILLSTGPYSDVPAAVVGLTEAEWLDRSLVIRREHECTHYYTYRVFGLLRSHVHDELVADFVGLVRAFGAYRADLARHFLGLEGYPAIRQDGRLALYAGTLSADAVAVLGSLAVAASGNLEGLAARLSGGIDVVQLAAVTHAMSLLTLEELASADLADRVLAVV